MFQFLVSQMLNFPKTVLETAKTHENWEPGMETDSCLISAHFHVMVIAMAHKHLNNLRPLQEARDQCRSEPLTLDVLSHHQRLGRSAASGEFSHPSEHSDFPTFHQLVQADCLYQPEGPPLPHEEYFRSLHLLNFYGTSQVRKQNCEYGYGPAGNHARTSK